MANQYDNTNSGALFKNNRKQQANHPDYNGKIRVRGEDFYVSAWIKEGKNGKFFGLALQPVAEAQRPAATNPPAAGSYNQPVPAQQPQRANVPFNDDIPF